MPHDFPESDWKRFRGLSAIALERFCERTLKEVAQVSLAGKETAHQRYRAVYRLIHDRNEQLARAFDGMAAHAP